MLLENNINIGRLKPLSSLTLTHFRSIPTTMSSVKNFLTLMCEITK